ncbi:MAG: hypothetical protein J6T59_04380, partial [Bacteroidales bacterium]|nr:hypothetical protein [Bacteroidales bacterium]
FSLDRKVTKDQADMNAARSVRPLTAAANVNKNAAVCKREDSPKALHFCKRKRLCTPLLEAGHSRRVRTACRHARPRALWADAP